MMNQSQYRINRELPKFKKQQGWTFWSLLFTASVVIFFGYVGMQLVPVYASNNNIKNAMMLSIEGSDLRKINRASIIKKIKQQLYLDGTHDLIDYKNELKIKRTRSRFVLEADYDQKIPLFANINILVEFNPTVDCDLSGRCLE
jgi:hypothetical protein